MNPSSCLELIRSQIAAAPLNHGSLTATSPVFPTFPSPLERLDVIHVTCLTSGSASCASYLESETKLSAPKKITESESPSESHENGQDQPGLEELYFDLSVANAAVAAKEGASF